MFFEFYSNVNFLWFYFILNIKNRTLETENERRAKSLQTNLKEASKKDAELFNLKSFKKSRNLSTNAHDQIKDDSMISPASSAFKGNRYRGDPLKTDDEGLSPTQSKFGSLRLFPTKEISSPRSFESFLFKHNPFLKESRLSLMKLDSLRKSSQDHNISPLARDLK